MVDTIEVHPANTDQLAAWDGGEGVFWADHADRFDRSIGAHQPAFLGSAGLQPTDLVLDVGCGAGRTTLDAARVASAGHALGVDLSGPMLAVARARAADQGVANASFLQADAQIHPFEPARFDVVLSRTGAMFFGDPAAGFANLRRALRPGGRLVLLTWQPLEDNEWLRLIAQTLAAGRPPRTPPPGMGPFSLSQPERVRELLEGAGFGDVSLEAHEAPMWFGADAADAQAFILGVSGWMLEGLDEAGRAGALDALAQLTTTHETSDGVTFRSATWLVTATAP